MVKELDDYLDLMKKKYPYVPRIDLKRVLEYGFETFDLLNRRGADVEIKNWRYDAYCGKKFRNDLYRTLYNHLKARIKYRLKYKYAQEQYNGIYYFGLNEAEWEYFQSQQSSKRRNKVTFKNIRLYKIKDESFLDSSKKYFFELNYPVDVGWYFNKEEITTRNYRYFAYRDVKGNIVTI